MSWHNLHSLVQGTQQSLKSAREDCKTYDLSAALCFQSEGVVHPRRLLLVVSHLFALSVLILCVGIGKKSKEL